MIVYQLQGQRVAELSPRGAALESERDATDIIGEALSAAAEIVVVPVERLSVEFFRLSTQKAGHFIQKFTNYRMRLVFAGDISGHVEQSEALADFVRESNRGPHVWFVADPNEVNARLATAE
jgi:Domain of unknown function (DUF4180)